MGINEDMDGPLGPVEPEEPDELERLRRRAYGPDADIAGDAAAQARLAELEAAQHRPRIAVGSNVELAAPAEGSAGEPGADDEASAPRRRWLAILGVAIADVALIAALITWMWPRAPDYVIAPNFVQPPDFVLALESDGADADEPKDPHGTLDRLGLNVDEMRRYEDFGYLSVWSGDSRYGTACLLVAHPVQGLNEGIGAEACVAGGVDAIADLPMLDDSLIRFVLRSDQVDVYVYRRAADPVAPPG
ncbi:hypothetical protein [Cryobacterium sp. AP23]